MTNAIAAVSPGRASADEQRAAVVAAVAGDAAAFSLLYERYSRPIYNMVLRSVRHTQSAEDVCQDVWLKAYRELDKLRDPAAFPLWLYRIAAKACIDAARRRGRAPATAELPEDLAAPHDDPEMAAIGHQEAQLTWEALAALPAKQHLALFLREVEQRSYREIGSILGISEVAAGLCLFRGRQAFVKTYHRLEQTTSGERCEHVRRAMSLVLDGEATAVQQQAVSAHAAGCRGCADDFRAMRHSTRAYAGLALAPAPLLLRSRIAEGIALATKGGGLGAGLHVLASLVAQTKPLVVALTATGALAGAALIAPGTPAGTRPATEGRPPAAHPQPAAALHAGYEPAPRSAMPPAPRDTAVTVTAPAPSASVSVALSTPAPVVGMPLAASITLPGIAPIASPVTGTAATLTNTVTAAVGRITQDVQKALPPVLATPIAGVPLLPPAQSPAQSPLLPSLVAPATASLP
ncbi:MAG: sigma-70 family RNA polymerase sigma factor [Chloroflexota bacterium]|nr:sigma-70 family RNA polymerase sigma factor [Chloroflexota bacterium]